MGVSAGHHAEEAKSGEHIDLLVTIPKLADVDLFDADMLTAFARSVEASLTDACATLLGSGGSLSPLQVRRQKRVRKPLLDLIHGECRGLTAGACLGEAIALIDEVRDAIECRAGMVGFMLENEGCEELVQPDFRIAEALLSEVRRPRRSHTLADMSQRTMDQLGDRQELIARVAAGKSHAEAVKELPSGRARSARWARRILRAHREHGAEALIDGRTGNGRTPSISARVVLATLACYFTRSRATPRAIREQLVLSLPQGEAIPSTSWIRDLIARLPAHLRSVRNHGKNEWRRNHAPRGRMPTTSFSNEVVEMDHCCLDIWVREKAADGEWTAVQPYLTAAIDVHSRAVVGVLLSTEYPNAWSVILTLRAAILPKAEQRWPMRGAMECLRTDLGKDFASNHVQTTVAALGIKLDLCDPHTPNQKPYIERFFRTLQGRLLVRLAGYKGAGMKSQEAAQRKVHTLLTLDELRAAMLDWILDCYNADEHGGLSQRHSDPRPNAVWSESAHVRTIPERDLDVLLLKTKVRRILRQGITLDGRTYASPELADRVGEDVEVRHHPEQRDMVIVYSLAKQHSPVVAFWVDSPNAQYTTADHASQRVRISQVIARTLRWADGASEALAPSNNETDAADVANALVRNVDRPAAPHLWNAAEVEEAECEIEDVHEDTEDESARRQFLRRLSLPAPERTPTPSDERSR